MKVRDLLAKLFGQRARMRIPTSSRVQQEEVAARQQRIVQRLEALGIEADVLRSGRRGQRQ